jgi:hypothetical protein
MLFTDLEQRSSVQEILVSPLWNQNKLLWKKEILKNSLWSKHFDQATGFLKLSKTVPIGTPV